MKLIFGQLVVFAMISFVGSFSFASFQGVWQGEGTVTTTNGEEIYCDEIILQVKSHADEKIEFGTFRYACDELAINFNPPVLVFGEKKFGEQEAYWNDKKVGKISSSKANLLFPLANNGSARYTVSKTLTGDMNYLDEQIGLDPNTGVEKITKIKAKLKKVN